MRALQKYVVVLLWLSVAFTAYRIQRHSPKQILSSDGVGYYSYLPALFIYHSPDYAFLRDYRRDYQPVHEFIREAGTGQVNQYFAGEALLALPFFGLASVYVSLTNGLADGFSPPYQWAFMCAALFYFACSLLLLRKVLLRFVHSQTTVNLLLVLLVWGTNLINYAAKEFSYSHLFSFFTFSALFYAALRLSETLQVKHLYTLVAAAALIALIRPSNLVVLCCLPFFMRQSPFPLIRKVPLAHLAGSTFTGILLLSIQPALWYWQTGNWLVDAYTTASFDFLHPHIYLVLFSFEKGWWLYTPLALVAISGIIPLFTQRMYGRWGVLVFLLSNIWIISSWSHWHYGPTFGQRPFVESYTLLVVLAGIGYSSISNIIWKRVTGGVALLLALLNVIQFAQYHTNILHPRYMNRELYGRIFLKLGERYQGMTNIPSNACRTCAVEIPLTLSGYDTLVAVLPDMQQWEKACLIMEGTCMSLPPSPPDFLLLEAFKGDTMLFTQRIYMQRYTSGEQLFPLYHDKVLHKNQREATHFRITYHEWSPQSRLGPLRLKICGQPAAH